MRAEVLADAMAGSYKRGAKQIDALLSEVAVCPDRDAALRGLAQAMTAGSPADAAETARSASATASSHATLSTRFSAYQSSAIPKRAERTLVPGHWCQVL